MTRALAFTASIRFTLAAAALAAVLAALAPQFVDTFTLLQATVFVAMAVLALSLGFIWGFGGILSFGQAAFFGLGGYAYAVAAFNFADSAVPVLLSVLVPMVFAALLGSFMFYGRISNVYVGVITLTVTLILGKLAMTEGAYAGRPEGFRGWTFVNLPARSVSARGRT